MVTPDGYAQKYPYKATLNAQNEVPPGESIANGQAEFTERANGNIKYRVNITGINCGNAVAAHIHTGAEGQNGDVVADLLYTPTSQDKDTAYGMIFRGTIDDSSLKGPMEGKTIDDLAAAIDSGKIYLNVQTTEHPDGEIRYQVSKSDKVANVGVRPETSIPGFTSAYRESKVILRYCYEHVDRPNPVQDLIDKGILTPSWFDGQTCITVKQFHDTFPTNYREEIRPYCHDGLKERLGHEPSEIEIDSCVESALDELNR